MLAPLFGDVGWKMWARITPRDDVKVDSGTERAESFETVEDAFIEELGIDDTTGRQVGRNSEV